MGMQHLPSRIVKLMIGTILVFVVTLVASVLWLSHALDEEAREQSLAQVRIARDNLLSHVGLTTLDYTKWETAVDALEAGDLAWVYENIGAAATVGQVVQLVVIWGGDIPGDLGWVDDGVEEGRPGLLEVSAIEQAESHLSDIPLGTYGGTEFFVEHEGSVYALGAARFEVVGEERSPELSDAAAEVQDQAIVRLIMGRRLSEDVIAGIAESTLLSSLTVAAERPSDRDSLPFYGATGEPVAYLAWSAPQPGTAHLKEMLPFLVVLTALAAVLVLRGMALVRRGAEHLVAAEKQASEAARTDALTGLPNRAAFNEVLLLRAPAGERAVLFLDVNDFKRINDSIGHAAGDQVIVCVARRLASLAGPNCYLARIAGDEFVFVLSGLDDGMKVIELAQDAGRVLAEPFNVGGHQLRLRMAMGYAIQATDDMTGDDLVRQADLAMYEAKRHNGGEAVGFSSLLEQAARDASVIEQALRRALLGGGELSVVYQPIVGTDGYLVRAEALARWMSPELGSVPPDRFIPVAEQAGLMVQLGRRLFQIICDDLLDYPELKVSINVSLLQLMAPDFLSEILAELRTRSIDPSRIEIELTESVLVDDSRLAADRLEELHAAGFSTALDDFGTGYSSVGYLQKLGFDTLKIDRSIVSGAGSSEKGAAVVEGIIRMAHGMDLLVVCEGVESAEEHSLLLELGCDYVQGYHIDRPLPINVLVERWLSRAGMTITPVASETVTFAAE